MNLASHSRQQTFCGSCHSKALALSCHGQHLLSLSFLFQQTAGMSQWKKRGIRDSICPNQSCFLASLPTEKQLCWVGPRWERAEWAEVYAEKCCWRATEGGQRFYGQKTRRRGWGLLGLVQVQFMVWVWVNVLPFSTLPVIQLPV